MGDVQRILRPAPELEELGYKVYYETPATVRIPMDVLRSTGSLYSGDFVLLMRLPLGRALPGGRDLYWVRSSTCYLDRGTGTKATETCLMGLVTSYYVGGMNSPKDYKHVMNRGGRLGKPILEKHREGINRFFDLPLDLPIGKYLPVKPKYTTILERA